MKKILIIDDQPGNIFLLQDRLNREGFKVITAYDGISGIEKAQNELPDLILLDVMMPGIDGFEVCSEISSLEQCKHIPIILVTALTSAEDTKRGFDAGAYDYIKKPFNKIELISRINSALRFAETNNLIRDLEKVETYTATVKKTNHELKQPLTLINLSVSALRRGLLENNINNDALNKRLNYIEEATKSIINIMHEMLNIDKVDISTYVENLKNNQFKIRNDKEVLE